MLILTDLEALQLLAWAVCLSPSQPVPAARPGQAVEAAQPADQLGPAGRIAGPALQVSQFPFSALAGPASQLGDQGNQKEIRICQA